MALKIKLKQVNGTPTTSNLENGEIAHNTSANTLHIRIGNTIHSVSSSGSIDLSAVDQDILPDTTNTRDLGSTSKRWRDIYLSSNSIDLAGATISSDGTGAIAIAATGATLPEGSKAGTNKIAVAVTGSGGAEQNAIVVPFFSNAGGLSTANANFNFNATVDEKFVFTGSKTFKLADGSNLADSNITLFQF